jgi:hypothetical protein
VLQSNCCLWADVLANKIKKGKKHINKKQKKHFIILHIIDLVKNKKTQAKV